MVLSLEFTKLELEHFCTKKRLQNKKNWNIPRTVYHQYLTQFKLLFREELQSEEGEEEEEDLEDLLEEVDLLIKFEICLKFIDN